MYYQPTPINWGNYRFLILSAPDNDSMKKCIKVILVPLLFCIGFEDT